MTETTTRTPRRLLAWLVAVVACVAGLAAPAASAPAAPAQDDNAAVAVNTEDGATVFRVAFSVKHVADGVVDQTNTAAALASCTDCRTVALAFQVVLVTGDADYVVPENVALAYNEQCVECFTYAAATQLVFGYDGPVRLTAEGSRRLAALQDSLREVEANADQMSDAELLAVAAEAERELVAIFTEEVVEVGRPVFSDRTVDDDAGGDGSTTVPGSTTTTGADGSGDGSTTDPDSTTTTGSTATTEPATTVP